MRLLFGASKEFPNAKLKVDWLGQSHRDFPENNEIMDAENWESTVMFFLGNKTETFISLQNFVASFT